MVGETETIQKGRQWCRQRILLHCSLGNNEISIIEVTTRLLEGFIARTIDTVYTRKCQVTMLPYILIQTKPNRHTASQPVLK